MNLPTSRSELLASGACQVAHVSSREHDGFTVWTELSLYWIEDDERPFIAVVEGRTSNAKLEQRFRACAFGTASRAMKWFDPTALRDRLAEALPDDLDVVFPDANVLRARMASEKRGYRGPEHMVDALAWLYGDADETTNALSRRVERDFGVNWRTVTNAINGGNVNGWAIGFIRALRFFDRGAWRETLRQTAEAAE